MKKKILVILLFFATITSLAACGNTIPDEQKETSVPIFSATESNLSTEAETESESETETTPISNSNSDIIQPEEFPDFIKDYVDLSHYNDALFAEGSYGLSCSFTRNSDYLSNEELFSDYTIRLEDNTSVKLGDKVSALLNQGAKYADEDDKNNSLEKQQSRTVYFIIGDKRLKLEIENDSDKPIPYSDATVSSISVQYYKMSDNNGQEKYKDAMDFIFDNIISQNDNLKSIINKLGEPILITFNKEVGIALLYSEKEADGSYNTSFNLSGDGTKLCVFNIRH